MSLNLDRIRAILARLCEHNPHITACALVTSDGLPLVSMLPGGTDEDLVAAMGAAILSVAERISGELKGGELRRILIESREHGILVVPVNRDVLLVTLFNPQAKLGLILYDVKWALEQLRSEVGAKAPLVEAKEAKQI